MSTSSEGKYIELASSCFRSFGFRDFNPELIRQGKHWDKCPINGCELDQITFGVKRPSQIHVCKTHGIRLHAGTFVYWNGVRHITEASLRNIRVRPDLAKKFVMGQTGKAENGRLGHEMSEDALSWNVFLGLREVGALVDAVSYLCGFKPSREPDLYLWGFKIVNDDRSPVLFPPLNEVRGCLEQRIAKFVTEPDIMLVIPGELLVCIEAKFGSGNTLAQPIKGPEDEKPKDIEGLIGRYLSEKATAANAVIHRSEVSEPLYGQLFRNIVFAAEMAARESISDWRVVNLISKTQWKVASGQKTPKGYSFEDPTPSISRYLKDQHKNRFSFRSWEGLYGSVLKDIPDVSDYMVSKSARFFPAFKLF